jgi:hypothetical protein
MTPENISYLAIGCLIGYLITLGFFVLKHRRSPLYGWVTLTYQPQPNDYPEDIDQGEAES